MNCNRYCAHLLSRYCAYFCKLMSQLCFYKSNSYHHLVTCMFIYDMLYLQKHELVIKLYYQNNNNAAATLYKYKKN